jgi:hypothetical protein
MCEAGAPKESPGTSRKPRTVVVVGGPMGALIVIGEAEGRRFDHYFSPAGLEHHINHINYVIDWLPYIN